MSNETIEKMSDTILAGISDKAMKTQIKTALNKLKKSALKDKFGSLPKIRPKETEVSFTKKSQRLTENIHLLSQNYILLIIKINSLALYFQDKGKGVSLFGWDFTFN